MSRKRTATKAKLKFFDSSDSENTSPSKILNEKSMNLEEDTNEDILQQTTMNCSNCKDLNQYIDNLVKKKKQYGGRAGIKRATRDYQNDESSSEESHSQLAKKAKKETEDFIKKQFQLRKCISAAKDLEQENASQITRIHQAQATSTKVSGLKISIRENYLTALVDALKQNVKESEEDKPKSYLVQRDFEDIAADIEYECFSKQKVINMYRHAIAKELSIIKQITSKKRLIPVLMDYVPRPEKKKKIWNGGSVEYFERKLKELEDERFESQGGVKTTSKKDVPKALRVPKSYKKEIRKQTTIGSFFNKTKCKSQDDDLSDISLSDEKEIEEKLDIKQIKDEWSVTESDDDASSDSKLTMTMDEEDTKHEIHEDNLDILISKEQQLKQEIEKLENEDLDSISSDESNENYKSKNTNFSSTNKRRSPSTSLERLKVGTHLKSKRTSHINKTSRDKYQSHNIYKYPKDESTDDGQCSTESEAENTKNTENYENIHPVTKEIEKILSTSEMKALEVAAAKNKSPLLSSKDHSISREKERSSKNESNYSMTTSEKNSYADYKQATQKSSNKNSSTSCGSSFQNSHASSNSFVAAISQTQSDQNRDYNTKSHHNKPSSSSATSRNHQATPASLAGSSATSAAKSQNIERQQAYKQKTDISKTVVEYLNPYYKRKIATKELFKVLAKRITTGVMDGKLAATDCKTYIRDTFHKLTMISDDKDLDKYFPVT